jgi:hypothetical protein
MRAPPWQGHSILANVSLDECGFTTDNTDEHRLSQICEDPTLLANSLRLLA